MKTTKNKKQQEREEHNFALQSMRLLQSLNIIASKMRVGGQGFLSTQKPVTDEFAGQESEKENQVAIVRVDFPSIDQPSQTGEKAGTLTFLTNRLYPVRGFVVTETVERLTTFKRLLRIAIETFSKHKVRSAVMFLFFRGVFDGIMMSFISAFYKTMQRHRLQEERYCQPVRELRRVMLEIDKEDGFSPYGKAGQPRKQIKDVLSVLLEFDDAYRYRFQWLPWNTEAAAKNPIREIRRMLALLIEAEEDQKMIKQWKAFRHAMVLIAFQPKIVRYLKRFFSKLNIDEIKMSVEDRYHAVIKRNFKWGLPKQEEYVAQVKM